MTESKFDVVFDVRPKDASPFCKLKYFCPIAKHTKMVTIRPKTTDRTAPETWQRARAMYEALEAGWNAQVQTHGDVNPNTLLMEGLYVRATMVGDMHKRRAKSMRDAWFTHLAPTLAKMRVVDVTTPFLEKLFHDIKHGKAPANFKNPNQPRRVLGDGYMYNIQSCINVMGKLARRKGWCPNFPAEFERFKRPEPDPDKWIDFEQRARVLDAADRLPDTKEGYINRMRLFVWFVFVTGQRRECILATELEWCDADAGTVAWSIHDKRKREGGNPKSPKSYFDFELHPAEPLRERFLAVFRRGVDDARKRGSKWLLFGRGGARVSTSNMYDQFKAFAASVGADVAHIAPHYGRSSFATNNLGNGLLTVDEVADFIGDKPSTVAYYYNKTPIEQRRRTHHANIEKRLAEAAAKAKAAAGPTVVPFRKKRGA